jgi:hypothetical protein
MAKKSVTTQDLVNIFPSWSKVRYDDQSLGFQLFNALAKPMEFMDKQLDVMKKNEFLTTVNLDEIDLAYKVVLPTTFEFELNTSDPTNPVPVAPTVQGLLITTSPTFSGYVDVALADDNDVRTFWYESIPNRVTIEDTAVGDFALLTQSASEFPWSGTLEHHLMDDNEGGGRIWVETTGGVQYVKTNEGGEVTRARVQLKGTTRKGTEEEETIVFPWDEKQPSLKEWKRLSEITVFDMEDDVSVEVRSADFNAGPYWSFYNLRVSDNRSKIDEFWDLDDTGTELNRVGLITDEWQQALLGFSQKENKSTWELIDSNWYTVTGVDMAVQPFTDRAWVVTNSGLLYLYALEETMASGIDYLEGKSAGALAQIDCETRRVILGEDIVFQPWLIRPIKEVTRFRVWYQDPSGQKYGLLNGSPVSYTSDFWHVGRQIKRTITEDQITINATMRGEYLIVLETEYIDGSDDSDRLLVQVQYKQPLVSIDIGQLVDTPVVGIDFDSDQKMWIRTNTKYYKLELHTDIMLIDYQNKILYFKEDYSDVQVTV